MIAKFIPTFRKIKRYGKLPFELSLIRSSGLFDEDYYLAKNPDVAREKVDPLIHYLRYGGYEGRDPSSKFSSSFYLKTYEDVRKAGINPLVHYLKYGQREKRATDSDQGVGFRSPWPSHFPKTKYEDMKKSVMSPLVYLQQLSSEEQSIIKLLMKFDYFDPAWYLTQNIDLQRAGDDPWIHFVRYGINENRRPNPCFDPVWYLEFYNDVGKAGCNPLIHYLKYGIQEGRKPSNNAVPSFNVKNINILAVEHCTNSCKYCSTSSPYAQKISHPASSFFPWLDLLETERIPFKSIAITGGEPFLHPDLGSFVNELKERYPFKMIGVTTNFYWANEDSLRIYAPIIQSLGALGISSYENLITKLGGLERFNSLIHLLKELCPETTVYIYDRPDFISWELHLDKREVSDTCVTSDCYILRADGKISHCSIGAGLENRPEYKPIMNLSKERLFDLGNGVDGFSSWALKYPFDLCFHCLMWRKVYMPWRMDKER